MKFFLKNLLVSYFSSYLCICVFRYSQTICGLVFHPTGIESLKEENYSYPVGTYSIDDKRLQKERRGLNIIRMNDGKAIKRIVKWSFIYKTHCSDDKKSEIVLLVKRICCKFATAKGVFFDILLSETFVHVLSPPPIGCEWLSN